MAKLGWKIPDAATIQQANDSLAYGVRVAIGIAVAVEGFELAKRLYGLLLRGRIPVPAALR